MISLAGISAKFVPCVEGKQSIKFVLFLVGFSSISEAFKKGAKVDLNSCDVAFSTATAPYRPAKENCQCISILGPHKGPVAFPTTFSIIQLHA